MNKNINTICVFASSSNSLDKNFYKYAYDLGTQIAQNGYNIVYGGSTLGLMGEITASACKNGAEITGVMPELIYKAGVDSGDCTKFILTKGMRERKAKMDELSQALIALPGGFGTLEELSEMIVQKQLGYNKKPIVIMNYDNFYTGLIKFFDEIIEKRFAVKNTNELYFVADNAKIALDYINNYKEKDFDYFYKKINL